MSKNRLNPQRSQPFVLQNVTTLVAIAGLILAIAGFARAWYLDARRLRAWVTTDYVRLADPVAPNRAAQVIVGIKNTGAAPSLDLSGCIVIDSFPSTTQAKQLPDCENNPNGVVGIPSTSVVGVGVVKEYFHETRPLKFREASDLTDAKPASRLFVWGRLRYSDPYNTRGGTEFCFVWRPGTIQLDDCDGRNRVW